MQLDPSSTPPPDDGEPLPVRSSADQGTAAGTCSDRPSDDGAERTNVPDYDAFLVAYHQSHLPDIRRMIDDLPPVDAGVVLDLACGDGFYTPLLARRFPAPARILGVDNSDAYLARAEDRLEREGLADRAAVIAGDVFDLPLEDNSVELVWCAQSMITLRDPIRALAECARVLKPGGVVAVLENNQLHQLLLPWPPSVELAVQRARLSAMLHHNNGPTERDFARASFQMFRAAGLKPLRKLTYTTEFLGPLQGAPLCFLAAYFTMLWEEIEAFIDSATADTLREWTDPQSPRYLPQQRDFEMSSLNMVAWARKPG